MLYGGRSDDGFDGGAPKLFEKSGLAIWSSCERCTPLLVETLGAGEILLELLLLLLGGGAAAA